MARTNPLAKQITDLDDAAPNDFDPEEEGGQDPTDEESDSQEDDELAGTEHYVDVSKSELRRRHEVALGPKYEGSRISRQALLDDEEHNSSSEYEDAQESYEAETFADPEAVTMDVDEEDGDIDSDDAFGESDAENFKNFTFRGSSKRSVTNEIRRTRMTAADFMSNGGSEFPEEDMDIESYAVPQPSAEDSMAVVETEEQSNESESIEVLGSDGSNDEGSEIEESEDIRGSSDGGSDEAGDDEQLGRAELRKIMNEEQKSVVATISQAAKADAEKGTAVKQQRKAFDSLLNVRIRLQKALVATNSITAANGKDKDVNFSPAPFQAAEEAAIKLLNTLDGMRKELDKGGGVARSGSKRKRKVELDTSSSTIWDALQNADSAAMTTRKAILEKWSSKVRGATAMPVSRKLNTGSQQTIIDVLDEQLSNTERLVKRTKMPRSCAPVQAKLKLNEDPNIFDDADFYQMLLKELVDQRMSDSFSAPAAHGSGAGPVAQWTAVKEAKTKKNVDTKASKGRKLRYTVHEKLQNFMAPEDRGSWEQDAIDRFFGTLLGQQLNLGEEMADISDEEGGAPLAEEALMLFRS